MACSLLLSLSLSLSLPFKVSHLLLVIKFYTKIDKKYFVFSFAMIDQDMLMQKMRKISGNVSSPFYCPLWRSSDLYNYIQVLDARWEADPSAACRNQRQNVNDYEREATMDASIFPFLNLESPKLNNKLLNVYVYWLKCLIVSYGFSFTLSVCTGENFEY